MYWKTKIKFHPNSICYVSLLAMVMYPSKYNYDTTLFTSWVWHEFEFIRRSATVVKQLDLFDPTIIKLRLKTFVDVSYPSGLWFQSPGTADHDWNCANLQRYLLSPAFNNSDSRSWAIGGGLCSCQPVGRGHKSALLPPPIQFFTLVRGGCQWSKFGGTNDLRSLVARCWPPLLMISAIWTKYFFNYFLDLF